MTEYYSIQSSQDVIEHFGIKGMKWGQRRIVSSRGAARAQRKLTKLNKRMSDTAMNRFMDEFAGSFQGLDGQYRRYQNGRKIEKQQAKILSNKKGISYKDAYKQVRKPYDGAYHEARNKWKESKSKYGKNDPRTLRDKMKYREELYRSSRKDLMDKSGHYVHERTMSNSFINNYGANASMYGGRAAEYQRMARKAGLKG